MPEPPPEPRYQLEPMSASEMQLLQEIFRSDIPMSIKACETAAAIVRKIREAKSYEPPAPVTTNGATEVSAAVHRAIDGLT
jgi:hypothetical protein